MEKGDSILDSSISIQEYFGRKRRENTFFQKYCCMTYILCADGCVCFVLRRFVSKKTYGIKYGIGYRGGGSVIRVRVTGPATLIHVLQFNALRLHSST